MRAPGSPSGKTPGHPEEIEITSVPAVAPSPKLVLYSVAVKGKGRCSERIFTGLAIRGNGEERKGVASFRATNAQN